MYAYANVHIALEKMRVRALRALHGSPPPPGAEDSNDTAEPLACSCWDLKTLERPRYARY